MILPKTYNLKRAVAFWLGVLPIVQMACTPRPTRTPIIVTDTPSRSVTATMQCEQELVPPQITEIQPAEPIAGKETTAIGSGGYVRDTCGGYIEGSRVFKLYLDDEPTGELSCYVNRCEGKFTLPSTLSAGLHCLSIEVDKCQFEFQSRAE